MVDNYLISSVRYLFFSEKLVYIKVLSLTWTAFEQAQPKKICSQIGLCSFDGTRGVRFCAIIMFYALFFAS